MRIKSSLFRAAAITVTALTFSVSSSASAATYVLTQLTANDLDLGGLTVTGINEHGQISGYGSTGAGNTQAIFWDTGQTNAQAISFPASNRAITAGINESGRIVGTQTNDDGIQSAFTFDIGSGQLNAFGLGGTTGNGINDAGSVVGGRLLGNTSSPFLYNPITGETTIYGLPSIVKSAKFSFITNDGRIIGERVPVPEPVNPNPLVLQPDVFVMNNALGSVSSDPFSLTRRTDFVAANNTGQYAINVSFPQAPFFINSVSLRNFDGTLNPAGLGRLPGDPANYGGGFNDQLDFVGESYNENRYGGVYGDAIITRPGAGTVKLSSLVSNLGGNFLQQGQFINNRGLIVIGYAFDANYRRSIFLLTPENVISPGVPEPASWALMIAGFGLVGGAMRRQTTTVRYA